MLVRTFFPKPAVEGLDEGVVRRLSHPVRTEEGYCEHIPHVEKDAAGSGTERCHPVPREEPEAGPPSILTELTAPLLHVGVGVGLGVAHTTVFDPELVVAPFVNDEDPASLPYMRDDRHQRPVKGLYFFTHFPTSLR